VPNRSAGPAFTNVPRTASAVSEVRPYASCMELEGRPASEVERFVAFARANGGQCRRWAAGHRLTFDVPLARDPTEARRIALDVIARFSAENTRADVRVTRSTDPSRRAAGGVISGPLTCASVVSPEEYEP
jgi:hypothetical protein